MCWRCKCDFSSKWSAGKHKLFWQKEKVNTTSCHQVRITACKLCSYVCVPACSALLLLYVDVGLWIECFKFCVYRLLQSISRKAALPPPPHSNSRLAGTFKDILSKALWCCYRADTGHPVKITSDQTRWKFMRKGFVKNKNNCLNEKIKSFC